MRSIVSKIIFTPKKTLPAKYILATQDNVMVLRKRLEKKIGKLFSGSLAIRQIDAGSDNGPSRWIEFKGYL